jgi:hypothetical protein
MNITFLFTIIDRIKRKTDSEIKKYKKRRRKAAVT